MALSVLVALMMLAVPLASSSNLFVDGGQTNSNGDAPNLGAAPGEGYTITFQLNSDGKSLDAVKIDTLPTKIAVPKADNSNGADEITISWYQNEKGDLCALVTDKRVTVQKLINALYSTEAGNASLITKGEYEIDNSDTETNSPSKITKYAYDLTSWKDANSGVMYLYKNIATEDKSPAIDKDMTFDAQWLLDEKNCVEIPVKVTFDGETKEYVKAYPYKANSDNTQITVDPAFFKLSATEKIMGVKTTGQSVNPTDLSANTTLSSYKSDEVVYTFAMKDSKDVELSDEKDIVVADNSIIINYTLKSTYSKVTVSSAMFENDVVMYTKNNTPYTYVNVYYALQNVTDDNGKKIFEPATINDADGSVLVNDGSYKATSWNDNVPLDSAANAVPSLTLNATLNSYKVVFMVNGEYEIVTVNYGELSADKCPLDITGLSGWYMPKYATSTTSNDYSGFEGFYFTESNIADLEKKVTDSKGAYVPVFIAAFTADPSFAVFNAVKNNDGNFGDKAVTNVVIPVKADSTIPEPAASPVYKEKTLFLGWTGYDTSKKAEDYKNEVDEVTVADKVITFSASVTTYKYLITFYDGDKSVGIFYMSTGTGLVDENSLKTDIAAIQYDGNLYGAPTGETVKGEYKAIDAYDDLIHYAKNGYKIKQWNDTDKSAMITFASDGKVKDVNLKVIKSNISLYGQFNAEEYVISYSGNTATMTNEMKQFVKVDENVNLFSDSTFSNDGFKLKEWNTRPDGKGTSYNLGTSFSLSGEQYKDLKDVDGDKTFTLYAIWEKVGSSDNPSGNTDGDNDNSNNTDTYLLAGILVVIIILIIVVAVVLRKKN